MSYAPPTVGAAGLIIPSYSDILSYLISAYLGIYGQNCYLGTDSPDYQDMAVRALQASDTDNAMQQVYLSMDPRTAIGPALDKLGSLIGPARKVASYSTVVLTLIGASGTVVTNGVARDANGNYWVLPASVTIQSTGSVSVTATAQTIGNITANPGTINQISSPTAGWTSVSNSSAAVAGNAIEPDSSYRARLLISQALPSITLLAGTAAALAAVPGVTRSMVYENSTNSTDANGNPPHSITCVVEGGASTAIAQAIYNNRGIGCFTNGTTTVAVIDPNNGNLSMNISYDVLTYLQIYVTINVHPLAGFTSSTQLGIQTGIVKYLNSLGIGEAVVYGELYGAALSARSNPDQPSFAIVSVTDGYTAAATSASLNSTTLVTVSLATGIAVGQVVVGTGIPAGTTVAGVSGTNVTLSAAATITIFATNLVFFTLISPGVTIPMVFNQSALGLAANVVVNLV